MPAKPLREKPKAVCAAPAENAALATFGRNPAVFLFASLLVLIPCFWQSNIQAGDLGSHLYNAWLVKLIRAGQAPGLEVAAQKTNVLFDWMLSALIGMGPQVAQRIAVSIAVLVFFWGAFAFVSVVSKRRAWAAAPVIGLLAYGYVFHMGFFNFYISMGLCFAAMALLWERTAPRIAGAAVFAILACMAHTLPVMWAAALMAYVWAGKLIPVSSVMRLVGTIGLLVVGRFVLVSAVETRWSPNQMSNMVGADQAMLFGSTYLYVFLGLLALWIIGGVMAFRERGWKQAADDPVFHFCVLTGVGILLIPTWVMVPGYKHALVYIAERMSLGEAVCICAVVGWARPRTWHWAAMAAVTAAFFALLFHDESILNSFEATMTAVVSQLPPNQRVISAIDDPALRAGSFGHMIDRICIGHCYSYANYEPSTAQFRVRVTGPNPIVASTYEDSWRLQNGGYVVKPSDAPLYQVRIDSQGNIGLVVVPPGTATTMTLVNPI